MDLNTLLQRHRLALMAQEKAGDDEERRAYCQFARDYLVQIEITRTESGAPEAVCRFPKTSGEAGLGAK